MQLITNRDRIVNIVNRFKTLYNNVLNNESWIPGKTHAELLNELEGLDLNTVSEDQIISILGNDLWVKTLCNVCNTYQKAVISLNDNFDFAETVTYICPTCLKKASNLMDNYLKFN